MTSSPAIMVQAVDRWIPSFVKAPVPVQGGGGRAHFIKSGRSRPPTRPWIWRLHKLTSEVHFVGGSMRHGLSTCCQGFQTFRLERPHDFGNCVCKVACFPTGDPGTTVVKRHEKRSKADVTVSPLQAQRSVLSEPSVCAATRWHAMKVATL